MGEKGQESLFLLRFIHDITFDYLWVGLGRHSFWAMCPYIPYP